MLNSIYNQQILYYAGNVTRVGKIEHYNGTATETARICGSRVCVELLLKDEKIVDFGHEVKACALGQASSAMMAEIIIGSEAEALFQLQKTMHCFLKEDGPEPSGDFKLFACLEPVKEYKNRHASALLTFDAVAKALQQAQNAGSLIHTNIL